MLRAGLTGELDAIGERTKEIEEIAGRLAEAGSLPRRTLAGDDSRTGYARWAETYDEPGNELIALEQPIVRGLIDELPNGPVLDAACGTGRHARYMVDRGREVIGVDASEEMLAVARRRLPDASLHPGDLDALPLADESVGAIVCALALSHLPEIGSALMEMGRVLRPGGELVISNPHPFATGILGWRAVYMTSGGERRTIPEYPHRHADYIDAINAAGLVVRRCIEPGLTVEQARGRAKLGYEDAFEEALTGLPAVIVWEAEKP